MKPRSFCDWKMSQISFCAVIGPFPGGRQIQKLVDCEKEEKSGSDVEAPTWPGGGQSQSARPKRLVSSFGERTKTHIPRDSEIDWRHHFKLQTKTFYSSRKMYFERSHVIPVFTDFRPNFLSKFEILIDPKVFGFENWFLIKFGACKSWIR